MKLLGRNRTPEQRLREAVEASDSGLEMRVSALLRPYGYMSPTPASLERVEKALESVGLIAEPSIRGRSWDEHVVVRHTSAGETPTATRERGVPPPPPPDAAGVPRSRPASGWSRRHRRRIRRTWFRSSSRSTRPSRSRRRP